MDYYPDSHASSLRILLVILLLAFLIFPCMAGVNCTAVHAAENQTDGSDDASAEEGASAALVSDLPVANAADAQDNHVIALRFTVENEPVSGAGFTCIWAGNYSDFPEVRKGTAEKVLQEIAAEEAKGKAMSSEASGPSGAAAGTQTAAAGTPTGTAGENGLSSDKRSGLSTGGRIRLTGKTDGNGELQFTGLPEGVYVIKGEDVLLNDSIYSPQPFLMSARDPETEEPVTAQIKYERTGRDTEKPAGENNSKTINKISHKLPQTGLPWNRIRLMCAAGLLLIAAGTALRTPRRKQPGKPAR